ncbi:SLAP domain-containing protein [Lactobacillus sp. ESL0228]|uniref:SLAP domain-containing protein n=1 Tax=Lactobacillus sp. ESL0228 TaxID=2069352 RepID=UPI000EFC34B3|nr:amidase [Lactobacillus sp. ESL0228]
MKMKKLIATIAMVIGMSTMLTARVVEVHASAQGSTINSNAKQESYGGLTYLQQMLQQEGIKYNCFYTDNPLNYRNGKPEGVVIHETATPNASAHDEAVYFNREWMNIYSYVHAFVDHNGVIQMMTPAYGVWGAGPIANNRFFQVELCEENNLTDFTKSINNDAIYVAQIMHRYNIVPVNAVHTGQGTVWSHRAVSQFLGGTDHGDPDGYFAKWGYSMDDFFDLIKYYYDKPGSQDSQSSQGTQNPDNSGNHDKDNHTSQKPTLPEAIGNKTLMHNAKVYDENGVATSTELKKAGVKLTIYGDKIIKNKKYLQVGLNQYVVASNVEGKMRLLKHNAYMYDASGNRTNLGKLFRGNSVRIYGGALKITNRKYYQIGINQFVKVGNF